MPIKKRPSALIAGVDNILFDERDFGCSRQDIEHICRFFDIGKLRHFEKEKGVSVSHSNFFVFAATSRGEYALKFYPAGAAHTITVEYALNRFLRLHSFPTPTMYAGRNNRPFAAINDHLATCFSYINGSNAWKSIRQQKTIQQINSSILSLKKMLSTAQGRIPLPKHETFLTTIKSLTENSRFLNESEHKRTVKAALLNAHGTYRKHKSLFTRQVLHSNINLTNLLIHQKTVYVLDLSHIREDYAMNDLASLVISSHFLKIPAKTIKCTVEDYFKQHNIKKDRLAVLECLVKTGLIREYLKNVQRERAIGPSNHPTSSMRLYTSCLSNRKKLIVDLLRVQ